MATPLYGGAFKAPQQERSFTQKLGRALSGFGAGYEGKGQEFMANLQAQDKAQEANLINATLMDALDLQKALESNDTSLAMNLLQDRARALTSMGQDAGDTIQLQNSLMQGDVQGVLNEVNTFVQGANRAGYGRPQAINPNMIYQGKVFGMDPQGNITEMADVTGSEGYIDPALQSEVLRNIQSETRALDKGTDEVITAFNKVIGLEEQMRAGKRGAINAGIMNVARLISPGVVTDADARAISGGATSIGALYDAMLGKGFSPETLVQIFDPANPETFDVDALINVAKSVTASAIPALQGGYLDAEERAKNFNAPAAFMRSFFRKDSERMTSLEKILEQVRGFDAPAESQGYTSYEDIVAADQAGTAIPGEYEVPDPENPGQVITVKVTP